MYTMAEDLFFLYFNKVKKKKALIDIILEAVACRSQVWVRMIFWTVKQGGTRIKGPVKRLVSLALPNARMPTEVRSTDIQEVTFACVAFTCRSLPKVFFSSRLPPPRSILSLENMTLL